MNITCIVRRQNSVVEPTVVTGFLSDVWPRVERGTLYSVSGDAYAEVKVICRGRYLVCKCSKARKLFTPKVNCFKL